MDLPLTSASVGAAATEEPRARLVLLVNPRSGSGRGAGVGRAAATRLRGLGYHVEVLVPPDARTAEVMASEAVRRTGSDGFDALVVVGGDGMVHLGVNVVTGTRVALGVVPAGTGNDLARAWGLPSDPVAAVDTIDACVRLGSLRPMDAIRVQPLDDVVDGSGGPPRWVAGVVAAGFDAVVNERANGWRWPRGAVRYTLATARELPVFRPVPYRLVLDGEEWSTEGLLVAVANTTSYGGGMRIAPDASPADGLLDVVVVKAVPLHRFVRLFPQVFKGTHVQLEEVEVRRAATVEVAVDHGGRHPRRIVAYGDGERLGPLPRRFEAVGRALAVLTPARP